MATVFCVSGKDYGPEVLESSAKLPAGSEHKVLMRCYHPQNVVLGNQVRTIVQVDRIHTRLGSVDCRV